MGNLTWLYYMLANDRWISPRCHLLHYPLVRGGMSEMKNMVRLLKTRLMTGYDSYKLSR